MVKLMDDPELVGDLDEFYRKALRELSEYDKGLSAFIRAGDTFIWTTPGRMSPDNMAQIQEVWSRTVVGYRLLIIPGTVFIEEDPNERSRADRGEPAPEVRGDPPADPDEGAGVPEEPAGASGDRPATRHEDRRVRTRAGAKSSPAPEPGPAPAADPGPADHHQAEGGDGGDVVEPDRPRRRRRGADTAVTEEGI